MPFWRTHILPVAGVSSIVKILNLYIILSCTNLYHFAPVSIDRVPYFYLFIYLFIIIIIFLWWTTIQIMTPYFPFKKGIITLNKSVINYLPRCTSHLLYFVLFEGLLFRSSLLFLFRIVVVKNIRFAIKIWNFDLNYQLFHQCSITRFRLYRGSNLVAVLTDKAI